tara:strand:+ start:564 stop:1745 length:1182 start_codon:yes stop_codon:yes gene_type:complete
MSRRRKVELRVKTPNFIPGPFYICGNLTQVGSWTKHHKLSPYAEDEYHIEIRLNPKEIENLEFKFTCGDFDSVEVDSNWDDIENRKINLLKSKQSSIHVEIQNIKGYQRESLQTSVKSCHNLGDFHSKILGNSRNLSIVYPPSFAAKNKTKYPILYLHDGNNMFDCSTSYGGVEWALDKVAWQLMNSGLMQEIILVGVSNTSQREAEYTPTRFRGKGGLGPKYLDCLVDEIIPFVESNLPVKTKARGLLGSSYGGLITLLAAKYKRNFFSRFGIISPSLYWDKEWMIENFEPSQLAKSRTWMDIGAREFGAPHKSGGRSYVERVHRLHRKIQSTQNLDYAFYEDPDAVHNEMSWNRRVHLPLLFLYGTKPQNWQKFIKWRQNALCTWLKNKDI